MFDVDQSGIFNVGTGMPKSFETVAQTIANKHGASIEYIPIPENIKSQYQKYTCANLTNLNSVVDMQWTNIEDYINGK
jgi:ADP-L-glycero-D-manno-heptose 6-epimerase